MVASVVVAAAFVACSDSEIAHEKAGQVRLGMVGSCQLDTECVISVPHPTDVPLLQVVVGANERLRLADGVQVEGGSATNTGSGETNIGASAAVGPIVSVPSVTLRQNATVNGDVVTGGSIDPQPPVTVTGAQLEGADIPTGALAWTTTFSSTNGGSIDVQPGQSLERSPGQYGHAGVKGGATLRLQAGTYHFESLTLEPDSTLQLEASEGPTFLYVRSGFTYRGQIVPVGSSEADLVIVYMGSQQAAIERPLAATVVAPHGELKLAKTTGPYRGAFFARSIEVEPDVTIVLEPADDLVPLGVDASDPRACALAVPVDDTLPPDEAQRKYQRDVHRLCVNPGADQCEATLAADVIEDLRAIALQLVGRHVTPGMYLAVVRDRDRKSQMAELDPDYACRVLAGDEDGDLVPTDIDQCPDTPPLSPTDDLGCTDPNVPQGPNADDVDALIQDIGITADPRCEPVVPIAPPAKPISITAISSTTPPTVEIVLKRVEDQPADCPIFYQVLLNIQSNVFNQYDFVLRQSEGTIVGDTVVFTLDDTDPRTEGTLVEAMLDHIIVEMRHRITNGAGIRSTWSPELSFLHLE